MAQNQLSMALVKVAFDLFIDRCDVGYTRKEAWDKFHFELLNQMKVAATASRTGAQTHVPPREEISD